jgi:hypothetical protein
MPLRPVARQAKPERAGLRFYHFFDFPDGESVSGIWDIRGRFDAYIGGYPISGKTLIDVGTASGFLAFSAEKAGASVTAFEAEDATCWDRIPFRRPLDLAAMSRDLEVQKSSYWYAHHKLASKVETLYGRIEDLGRSGRRYDVVLAAAIVEHLSNPVLALEHFARIAGEAVIIGFTPVLDSDQQMMETMNDWSDPQLDYTWWHISRGLYDRVFANLGFRVSYHPCVAHFEGVVEHNRTTIVAQRI